MKRRGVALVVASVFLTLLAILLAVVIWLNMNNSDVVSLSPEIDCFSVDYNVDIEKIGSGYYLNAVNYGKLRIEGFHIKHLVQGELVLYEEVSASLGTNEDDQILLDLSYGPGNYLIVPVVVGEDLEGSTYLSVCKNIYGEEIVIE